MEKFQFENYRNKLAKELKETREKDNGRKNAKEILKNAKNSTDYKAAKKFHQIKNEFPKQVVVEAMDYPKRIDDPAMWDVEDVSDKIPDEYKYTIDKATLHDISRKVYSDVKNNKERWDVDERIEKIHEKPKSDNSFEREKEKKEIENFLDALTGHRLLDGHNLNHCVMGQGNNAEHFRAKAFDRYSKIDLVQVMDFGDFGPV